jgi:amino acid adenylation domain-containing protein
MTRNGNPAGPATLVDLLRSRAEAQGDRRAYTFLGETGERAESTVLTWAGLDERARAIAAAIQERGLAGERALLLYPPGIEFVAAFFGCLYAGVVAVPSYPPRPNRDQPRLRAIARDARPRVALADSAIASRADLLTERIPELAGAAWIATDALEAGLATSWRNPGVSPETVAFLQYTSGSTATPKGVIVSHGNLLHNEEMIRRAFGQSESSVIVGWLPLYHDMGLIGNVLQPLYLGAPCYLMSPVAFLQQPLRWLEAISLYRATTSGGPNFAYELCVRRTTPEQRAGLDLSSWTAAFNGAEPVRAETLERFAEAFAPAGFRREAFYPCYGLAEATLFVSGGEPGAPPVVREVDAAALERHRAEPAGEGAPPAARRSLVGCGHGWMNQRVVVADPETGEVLQAGKVGEVWVAGPSVAQGYWGRDEETERTFRARLAGTGEGPFLRTGDLGFYDATGTLFLTGRIKDLIILRGRNLYPQDVERTAEVSHPALRPGNSAAFAADVDGEERLVVVHEVERGWKGTPEAVEEVAEAVRRAVAEEHEAAVHQVVLLRPGSLPKTSSGKVQRHAARAAWQAGELEAVGASAVTTLAAAETVVAEEGFLDRAALLALAEEERTRALVPYLRRLAARAARVQPAAVPWDRPLTILGLDSLAAVELKHAVEADLGVPVSLSRLLEGASLEEIAGEILQGLGEERGGIRTAAHSAEVFPLSYGQRSLRFLERLAPPGATFWTLAGAARVHGDLDPAAFRRALGAVAERHPALRTTFHVEGGEPVQRVHASLPPEFVEGDATGLDEAALRERLEGEIFRPFDLASGSLLRAGVFRLDEGHALFLAVHHLVSDLWSIAVLVRELEAFYREAAGGAPADLAPLPVTYADYVDYQRSLLEGPRGQALWDYWREQLGGDLPVLDLPADRPRPPVQTYCGASRRLVLDSGLSARIRSLAREREATLYVTLLAGFEALLHRYSGQDEILLGTPTAGRTAPELAGLIGYFVSPVVLRAEMGGSPGFAELVARTRRTALAAFEHQDFPFALLAERLQTRRDPSRSPLFQAFFVLEQSQLPGAPGLGAYALGQGGVRLDFAGLGLESFPLEPRSSQFDLMLLAAETPDGLVLALDHNPDLFDAATIDRMLAHLRELLAGALDRPELPVGDLPWLTAAERAEILGEGSALPALALPEQPGPCLHQLFEAQAERTPEATAVVLELDELTYGELNRRANRLAHHLRGLGVGPEVRVCLALERSPEQIVAILAVLKAGGAYVPLDPSYPAERLSWLLEDAGRGQSDLLLVSRRAVLAALPEGLLPAGLGVVDLDADRDVIAARSAENPDSGVTADNLAYVIYTSGSTGRPKGVLIEHARVVRLFTATEPWFGFGAEDVWTMFHSYAFDFSVWEIWGALAYGGRLVIVPRSVARSPEAFHELLADEGVTVLSQTPSAFRQLLHADEDDAVPLALRAVVFGGEALDPSMLGGWLERHGEDSPRLINMYGITETTVHVTYRPIGREDTGGASAIGRPIPDLQLYLLDRRMQPVPAGVPGEICVGGAGLARGYLHRPDLTAERFVPDPFAGRPGARLYKSGDLARRRPAPGPMDLEYLGRIDHQVKVRGFRIELGEIEAALGSHPAVREAVVLAQSEPAGTRLVAYLVPHGAAPTSAELREDLGTKLPDYMVPASFVFLPALPLTATGKVDRRALTALGQERTEEEPALPRNATEETLAAIWRDLLGIETVGVHDDFFELGGHSLLETRLVSRIRDRFGVELTLAQVFSAPTVAGLAAAIESAGGALPAAAPIPRARRDQPIPLSFGQERLWFLDQLEGRSTAYAVPAAVRLCGRLDRGAFAAALNAVAARHEALRTSFPSQDGKPVQAVAPSLDLAPPEIDLRSLPEDTRDAEARRLAAEEGTAPFDLATGPLVRARLLTLEGQEHLLLLTLHHAISDGWSLGLLVHELAAFYLPEEGRPRLPELPIQYADYAAWQRQRVDSGELDSQLAYWKEQLAGAPPRLDLPLDRPRPAAQTFRGRRFHRRLPRELAVRLEALAHRQDATLFMVLFAAFAALLHRLAGPEDLVIGTPIANRNRSELEPLIGFFVNTLALRADLSGDPAFADVVARLRPAVLGAYDHQDLPFERLVAELRPERNLAETPLFQVLFALQNNAMPALRLPGMELEPLDPDNGTAKFDLTFEVAVSGEGILLSVEHSTDLFDNTRMERWADSFHRVLEAVAEAPERPVSALPLLSAAEAHQLRVEWNDTDLAFPEEACLHELFQAQAARTPGARALRFEGTSLTYRELAERASGLAGWLRRAGVGPDVPVGLCAERGVEMMVAVLGILEAGGAYLPLDPSHPRERLERIAVEAGIPVLLLGPGVPKDLAAGLEATVGTVLRLGGEASGLEAASGPWPLPQNLAYILYTSGSTGQPKGVQITHRSVVSFLTAVRGLLRPAPREGMIAETTLSFDISVVELFLPILTGGWVELVSRDVAADGARLGAALAASGVQRMQATPAGWRILLDAGWEGDRNLVAISGGEALDPDLADRLLARTGGLWNIYGPTEATIWSAVQEVRANRPPRVGRPIGNNRVYLLDRRLSLLPLGSAGELCIGGTGLARGYRGRPDLTAERFLPDPFSEVPGARLYRTGDLIRWTAEGDLDFLGRIDFQVKIRGFRIELGEVEAALAAQSGVAQAVVTAREDRPGDRRLVAYFVPRPGEAVSLTDLRDFLASRLPPYMVPAAFVPLEAFPLSPNGKVDRRALPSPEGTGLRSGGEYVAPATPVEEELARLWAAALDVERVGTADNFFELGGHSLLATQLLARYRKSFGVELSLRDLFKAATVAELARLVETAKEQKGTAPVTPTIARVSRDRYRVTPGQAGKKSSVR